MHSAKVPNINETFRPQGGLVVVLRPCGSLGQPMRPTSWSMNPMSTSPTGFPSTTSATHPPTKDLSCVFELLWHGSGSGGRPSAKFLDKHHKPGGFAGRAANAGVMIRRSGRFACAPERKGATRGWCRTDHVTVNEPSQNLTSLFIPLIGQKLWVKILSSAKR